jgi:hypothetical protein
MSMQYNATVKVQIPQLVHCVHCDCKYIYEMARTGQGSAQCGSDSRSQEAAKRAAERAALDHLDSKLQSAEACDPVPCRNCFCHQPYMRAVSAKKKYGEWGCAAWALIVGGIGILAVCTTVWFKSPRDRTVALGGALIGLGITVGGAGFLFIQRRLLATHDPDRAPEEERRRLARQRTMSLADFNEVQAMRIRTAYQEHVSAPPTRSWKGTGNPWAETASKSGPEPLVVGLWVEPALFIEGGVVPIKLSETDSVTLNVPPDAKPGEAYDVVVERGNPVPFKVRITPIRVHPGEMRLE